MGLGVTFLALLVTGNLKIRYVPKEDTDINTHCGIPISEERLREAQENSGRFTDYEIGVLRCVLEHTRQQ